MANDLLYLGIFAVCFYQIETKGCIFSEVVINSTTQYRYSTTQVVVTISNFTNNRHRHHRHQRVCNYSLFLPQDIRLSSIIIDLNGEKLEGKVNKKRKIKKEFTLKEEDKTNNDIVIRKLKNGQKLKITNLNNVNETTITIVYEQLLQRIDGIYNVTIPLPMASVIHKIKTRIQIIEREKLLKLKMTHLFGISTPEEAITDGKLNQSISSDGLSTEINYLDSFSRSQRIGSKGQKFMQIIYDVTRTPDAGEIQVGGGHFVHFICPEGGSGVPVHTVFVLDISGSMSSSGKMKQLQQAMSSILPTFTPRDSFEVIVFSTRVQSLGTFNGTSSEIKKAVGKVQRLQAFGGTNINDALLTALQGKIRTINTKAAKQIMFLTDGKATVSETIPDVILDNVQQANSFIIPIYGLALGNDANMTFLRKLGNDSGGSALQIFNLSSAAVELKSFYSSISRPLVTDLQINYPNNQVISSSLVRSKRSIVYAGEEVVNTGQLQDGVKEVTPEVSWRGPEGNLQLRVNRHQKKIKEKEENMVDLSRLWAYAAVQDMLETLKLTYDPAIRNDLRSRALNIALKYNFVTRFTSLSFVKVPKKGRHHDYQSSTEDFSVLESKHFDIMTEESMYSTLPSQSRRYLTIKGFGDSDPHFVVQISGTDMPLCFDIHGKDGDVLNLIRDPVSGIRVNGGVGSSKESPNTTYFTQLFISLEGINITINTKDIHVAYNNNNTNQFQETWPFYSENKRKGRDNPAHRRARWVNKKRKRKRNRLRNMKSSSKDQIVDKNIKSKRVKRFDKINNTKTFNKNKTEIIKKKSSRKTKKCKSCVKLGKIKRNVRHEKNLPYNSHINNNNELLQEKVTKETEKLRNLNNSKDLLTAYSKMSEILNNIINQLQLKPLLISRLLKAYRTFTEIIKYFQVLLHIEQYRNKQQHFITDDRNIICQKKQTILSTIVKFIQILRKKQTESNLKNIPQNLDSINIIYSLDSNNKNNKFDNYSTKNLFSISNTTSKTLKQNKCYEIIKTLNSLKKHMTLLSSLLERDRYILQERQKSETPPVILIKKIYWRRKLEYRFGDIILSTKGRQLHILKGDLALHFTVTLSISKTGQHFLGFYIQQQTVLSQITTGIIGQFQSKSLVEKNDSSNLQWQDISNIGQRINLDVMNAQTTSRNVSQVSGYLSQRRSLLHKKKVSCLHIRRSSRGLLDPLNYTLRCLSC